MVAAINLADKIDAEAILAMHKALMRDVDPKSRAGGAKSKSGSGEAPTAPAARCSCHRTTAAY